MKAMNEKIAAMLAKINDTGVKITNQNDKIIELSSKQSETIQNNCLNITSEHPSSEDKFDRKL